MKKIMKIAFVAAFAAVAGYGVYANQQSETMSDLMLANVEALAGSEYDRPFYVAPCKNAIKKPITAILFCKSAHFAPK